MPGVGSRFVALFVRSIAAVVAVVGWSRLLGLHEGRFDVEGFAYFTTLSTTASAIWLLAVVVVTAWDLVRSGVRGRSTPSARVGGVVLASAVITMVVHAALLAPGLSPAATLEPTNLLTHVVIPVLVVADWLLFAPKGRLRFIDPLWWAVPPYAYVAAAYVRRAIDGAPYPYPFMDLERLGLSGVVGAFILLTISLEALGLLIVVADRLSARWSGPPGNVRGLP